MMTVCDLADDLRDAIVEYQVNTHIGKYTQNGLLIYFVGCTAEGNLQAEL